MKQFVLIFTFDLVFLLIPLVTRTHSLIFVLGIFLTQRQQKLLNGAMPLLHSSRTLLFSLINDSHFSRIHIIIQWIECDLLDLEKTTLKIISNTTALFSGLGCLHTLNHLKQNNLMNIPNLHIGKSKCKHIKLGESPHNCLVAEPGIKFSQACLYESCHSYSY